MARGLFNNITMLKSDITFSLAISFAIHFSLHAQGLFIKDPSGDVGIHTPAPRYPLDMELYTPNHPTAQFGYFGIQSFSTSNGFLTANGFWNGTQMQSFNAGQMALLQFIGGKVFFRTTPTVAAGGTTLTLFNNIVATNNGTSPLVGIDEPNPTQALHVKGNALKTVGGNVWAIPSDKRLKKNIQNLSWV